MRREIRPGVAIAVIAAALCVALGMYAWQPWQPRARIGPLSAAERRARAQADAAAMKSAMELRANALRGRMGAAPPGGTP